MFIKILTHNAQQTQKCACLPIGKLIVFGLFVTLLFSAQAFAQRVTTIDTKGTQHTSGNVVNEGLPHLLIPRLFKAMCGLTPQTIWLRPMTAPHGRP